MFRRRLPTPSPGLGRSRRLRMASRYRRSLSPISRRSPYGKVSPFARCSRTSGRRGSSSLPKRLWIGSVTHGSRSNKSTSPGWHSPGSPSISSQATIRCCCSRRSPICRPRWASYGRSHRCRAGRTPQRRRPVTTT